MTTATHPAYDVPDTTTSQQSRRRMDPMRKVALAGGVLYLTTFAASIPQLALYANAVDDPTGYISAPRGNTSLQVGSLLELVTALSGIGTAVALYPMTRRISRTAGIGFVASRVLEAAMIFLGAVAMLTLVTLQGDFAGATGAKADALGVTGEALVGMRQWTFLVGPGLMAGVNAMFLGYAMYRSGLVPRIIPTIGLVGAPLIITSSAVTMLGGWAQVSPTGSLMALPIATWEFSLGLWLTFKGFKKVAA